MGTTTAPPGAVSASTLAARAGIAVGAIAALLAGLAASRGGGALPPESIEILAGVRRITATWRGGQGSKVRLVAEDAAGRTSAVPSFGPAAIDPDAEGKARLALEGLDGGREFTAFLEYDGGRSLARTVRTLDGFLRDGYPRLAGTPGGLALDVKLATAAAVTLSYRKRGGGAATASSAQALDHMIALDDLDLSREDGRIQIALEEDGVSQDPAPDPIPIAKLLEREATDLASRLGEGDVKKVVADLERLYRIEKDRTKARTEAILEALPAMAALKRFAPLARSFFEAAALAPAARRDAVNALEAMRRIERCADQAGVEMEPSPGRCLAGAYSLDDPGEVRAETVPLFTEEKLLVGVRDIWIEKLPANRLSEIKVDLPKAPEPMPPRARISIDLGGRLKRALFLQIALPGGVVLGVLAPPKGEERAGWFRRTFDPRDLAPEGGPLRITLHDAFGNVVAGEISVRRVELDWLR